LVLSLYFDRFSSISLATLHWVTLPFRIFAMLLLCRMRISTPMMFKDTYYKIIQEVGIMSFTFTVRITEELKEKMKKIHAKWSDETRTFIEERAKHFKLI